MPKLFDYAAANPPVGEDKLSELLKWLRDFPNAELPCEYTAFLRESNGGDFVKNGREFQMFAAEKIPEIYAAYKFSVYMPYALPFSMDGNGTFYVFNKRERDKRVYLVSAGNMGWSECVPIAESFNECIKGNFAL